MTLPMFPSGPLTDSRLPTTLRKYQADLIHKLRVLVVSGKRRVLTVSPVGCHAPGQLILMSDGTLKKIENIRIGDHVMGYGGSRKILRLNRGRGEMFLITPIKGDSWAVNEDHILTLVRTSADRQPHRNGELVDVSVKEWLTWPKNRKRCYKLIRSEVVEFKQDRSKLPISPYLLGAWLGDGFMDNGIVAIAIGSDQDMLEAIQAESAKCGTSVRVDLSRGVTNQVCCIRGTGGPGSNPVRNALRELGLLGKTSGDKFIPQPFLSANSQDRIQLLAGLLDTDGYQQNKGFDFVSKSEMLANGVAFLSRSLGLAAYVSECKKGCQNGFVGNYFRVSISGNTSIVPCRVSRKKPSPRKQKKDVLRTGFSISHIGTGDYYGFTLDGDGRYLLSDFTVTHNSGKMFVIANIIKSATVPVLFVCHRMELIDQCARELARLGITNVGVMRGNDERTNPSCTTQIASIQTLARRDKPQAGIVFVDEAHRAAGDSFREHIFEAYKDSIVFGFTASPARLDGRPLGGDLFQSEVVAATYGELLKNPEWLVAPDIFSVPEPPDLSQVQSTGGDYNLDQLQEVMAPLVGNVVEHWLRLAHKHPEFRERDGERERIPRKFANGARRRTVVFAAGILHSKMLRDRFIDAGVRAAHLDGETDEDERRLILARLASGELEVVTNCDVLTEGVDVPAIKCVVMARPTQSLVKHIQTAGRCMRPWQGQVPMLLDHAGNFDRHGAPFEDRVWSLSDKPKRISASFPMKLCKQCFAYVNAGAFVCPHCGWEFPQDAREIPKASQGELEQRSTEPTELKRRYFDSMAVLARSKGYKPGFASAKFKEQYGAWPPYDWGQQLQNIFAQDPLWQELLRQREQRKAERAEQEAREIAAQTAVDNAGNILDESMPPYEEAPEDFMSWLEGEGVE